MRKIVHRGTSTCHASCSECGAVFTYQCEDVRTNYAKGGRYVDCPCCGRPYRHFGMSADWAPSWPCGAAWP